MTTLVVHGGKPLNGRIRVSGNKNAALPIIAACLLTEEECVLENVPRIRDVEVMADLLRHLGALVAWEGDSTLRVRAESITSTEPRADLVAKLRGSVLLLGPLLARKGEAVLGAPGGDFPSRRNLNQHHAAVQALGARVRESGGFEAPEGLQAASFYMLEASVTATETALLGAALAHGTTEIRHAACEPHVGELAHVIAKMGALVSGIGSPTLRITGSPKLRGIRHRISGDFIEAGSFAVVGAMTRGHVVIEGASELDLEPVVAVLRQFGLSCRMNDGELEVRPSELHAAHRVTTGLWPGFPSDMVSLVTVLGTQATGATLIHDWLYELRLFAVDQLSGMGADLFLCDPHRVLVNGPRRLRGRSLDSRDIRSGMALIAAALAADGESRISPLETVERGYEGLVERLKSLGAAVETVSQ
jgi:UDP-N-acetylglucosamine 1-carboxyvinyltransferase